MEIPKSADGIQFDPLLRIVDEGHIERVCHLQSYTAHIEGKDWLCYSCEHRAECNAKIFDRLAAYEMSGLSPKVVMNYKIFEDEVISYGLTFNDVLEHIKMMRGERK